MGEGEEDDATVAFGPDCLQSDGDVLRLGQPSLFTTGGLVKEAAVVCACIPALFLIPMDNYLRILCGIFLVLAFVGMTVFLGAFSDPPWFASTLVFDATRQALYRKNYFGSTKIAGFDAITSIETIPPYGYGRDTWRYYAVRFRRPYWPWVVTKAITPQFSDTRPEPEWIAGKLLPALHALLGDTVRLAGAPVRQPDPEGKRIFVLKGKKYSHPFFGAVIAFAFSFATFVIPLLGYSDFFTVDEPLCLLIAAGIFLAPLLSPPGSASTGNGKR